MGRRPILWRAEALFILSDIWGIDPSFPGVFPTIGYVTYVLLTRSPLQAETWRSTCMC